MDPSSCFSWVNLMHEFIVLWPHLRIFPKYAKIWGEKWISCTRDKSNLIQNFCINKTLLCLPERLMEPLSLLVLLEPLFSHVGLLLVKFSSELNEISKLTFLLPYGSVFPPSKSKLKRLSRSFIKEVSAVMSLLKFEALSVQRNKKAFTFYYTYIRSGELLANKKWATSIMIMLSIFSNTTYLSFEWAPFAASCRVILQWWEWGKQQFQNREESWCMSSHRSYSPPSLWWTEVWWYLKYQNLSVEGNSLLSPTKVLHGNSVTDRKVKILRPW